MIKFVCFISKFSNKIQLNSFIYSYSRIWSCSCSQVSVRTWAFAISVGALAASVRAFAVSIWAPTNTDTWVISKGWVSWISPSCHLGSMHVLSLHIRIRWNLKLLGSWLSLPLVQIHLMALIKYNSIIFLGLCQSLTNVTQVIVVSFRGFIPLVIWLLIHISWLAGLVPLVVWLLVVEGCLCWFLSLIVWFLKLLTLILFISALAPQTLIIWLLSILLDLVRAVPFLLLDSVVEFLIVLGSVRSCVLANTCFERILSDVLDGRAVLNLIFYSLVDISLIELYFLYWWLRLIFPFWASDMWWWKRSFTCHW